MGEGRGLARPSARAAVGVARESEDGGLPAAASGREEDDPLPAAAGRSLLRCGCRRRCPGGWMHRPCRRGPVSPLGGRGAGKSRASPVIRREASTRSPKWEEGSAKALGAAAVLLQGRPGGSLAKASLGHPRSFPSRALGNAPRHLRMSPEEDHQENLVPWLSSFLFFSWLFGAPSFNRRFS